MFSCLFNFLNAFLFPICSKSWIYLACQAGNYFETVRCTILLDNWKNVFCFFYVLIIQQKYTFMDIFIYSFCTTFTLKKHFTTKLFCLTLTCRALPCLGYLMNKDHYWCPFKKRKNKTWHHRMPTYANTYSCDVFLF